MVRVHLLLAAVVLQALAVRALGDGYRDGDGVTTRFNKLFQDSEDRVKEIKAKVHSKVHSTLVPPSCPAAPLPYVSYAVGDLGAYDNQNGQNGWFVADTRGGSSPNPPAGFQLVSAAAAHTGSQSWFVGGCGSRCNDPDYTFYPGPGLGGFGAGAVGRPASGAPADHLRISLWVRTSSSYGGALTPSGGFMEVSLGGYDADSDALHPMTYLAFGDVGGNGKLVAQSRHVIGVDARNVPFLEADTSQALIVGMWYRLVTDAKFADAPLSDSVSYELWDAEGTLVWRSTVGSLEAGRKVVGNHLLVRSQVGDYSAAPTAASGGFFTDDVAVTTWNEGLTSVHKKALFCWSTGFEELPGFKCGGLVATAVQPTSCTTATVAILAPPYGRPPAQYRVTVTPVSGPAITEIVTAGYPTTTVPLSGLTPEQQYTVVTTPVTAHGTLCKPSAPALLLMPACGGGGGGGGGGGCGCGNNCTTSPTAWLTRQNNNNRTGAALGETLLDPGSVANDSFGKLWDLPTDGHVYAQVLVVDDVCGFCSCQDVALRAKHCCTARSLVVVATMSNSVYAYNAATGTLVWKIKVGPAPPNTIFGDVYVQINRTIGILGTPVINCTDNSLYFVSFTNNTRFPNGVRHRLHRVSLLTGEALSAPTLINGSVPGTAPEAVNGSVPFVSFYQLQRPGLVLQGGAVYVAFGGWSDTLPYHGWVFAYNTTSDNNTSPMAQLGIYCTSPNSTFGGVWQAGAAGLSDNTGTYWVAGTSNLTSVKPGDTGSSIFRLVLGPSGLSVADYFTPADWAYSGGLGSSGLVAIPGTTLAATGSQNGSIYVVDKSNLGGLQAGDVGLVQLIPSDTLGTTEIYSTPVVWQSSNFGTWMYVWRTDDELQAYAFNSTAGLFELQAINSSSGITNSSAFLPGGILSLSANGGEPGSGIVWASLAPADDPGVASVPGILRALDAQNTTNELWNSDSVPGDSVGSFAKFNPPTISNGKVYLPNFCEDDYLAADDSTCRVNVYGLLP